EAVVHGDEVHAGARRPPSAPEQIGGAGHAAREVVDLMAGAGPGTAQGAAEVVVPFRPAGRKAAEAIAAPTEVPRLRDQLHAGEHRVAPDRREEACAALEPGRATRECGSEIEAEAVDVAGLDPVAQRRDHHLTHARM